MILGGCVKPSQDGAARSTMPTGKSLLATVMNTAKPTKAPLKKAPLAGGALLATAPDGYCIDPASLKRSFAIVSSCQALGASGAPDVPALMMTISTSTRKKGETLPSAEQFADALGAEMIAGQSASDFVAVNVRGKRGNGPRGSDRRHWRGAATKGNYVIGFALYAPEGTIMARAPGGAFLADMVPNLALARSQTTPEVSQAPRRSEGKKEGLLAGLFNR